MKTYKQQWLDLIGPRLVDYDEILAMDAEENFAYKNADVASGPLDDLLYALKLEIGKSVTGDKARAILSRALRVAEKVETTKRYSSRSDLTKAQLAEYTQWGRAQVSQALAFCRAILNNTDLDHGLVKEASIGYEIWAIPIQKSQWAQPAQSWYHDAVFLALSIGDIERALALITVKKSFNATKPFHEPLKKTIKDIAKAPKHKLDPQSAEGLAFQDFFDDIRNPDQDEIKEKYGISVGNAIYAAFHLALVKERFIVGNLGAPNWRRVFDSIAE